MKIGVLALQGAFAEHITVLRRLEVETVPVRLPRQLAGLNGLIIPGGESTTITSLMLTSNLHTDISQEVENSLPVLGTCAGMILLAREVVDGGIEPVAAMGITVRRNAFGRQKESFETDLDIPALGEKPFPGVFIRAPLIEQVTDEVEVLSRLDNGTIVAARQGKLLACAFHPELTDDVRFHQYYLSIVGSEK
jgi:5'-phosphate synthase pdxT subunit